MRERGQSRLKKKGRIKKTISEWDKAFENLSGFLQPSSWSHSRIELLHIAVALQTAEPEEILADLLKLKEAFNEVGVDWKGNLSTIFSTIQTYPQILKALGDTVIHDAIGVLLITYNKIFGIDVPAGNLGAHLPLYRAYHEINDRRNEISLLCKFIATKFLIGEDGDPTGLLLSKTRAEILAPENISAITAMWLPVSHTNNIASVDFAESIWYYNYYELPFLLAPSTKKAEAKNFMQNRMNERKLKLSSCYDDFKKIDLLEFFDVHVAEVIMGFISRQQYLFEKVIEQEERHEGEIAEATLRLLYENRVKFLWLITKQDLEAIKQFREYRAGRENLFLQHFMSLAEGRDDASGMVVKQQEELRRIMQEEGVEDYKLSTEKGDAFEKNLKTMADELGGDEPTKYFLVYKRTSDVIHGNWRIIERYHLERSINPAHDGLLRYSSNKEKLAGLLPSYISLLLSADLLVQFFDIHPTIKEKNKKLYRSFSRMHVSLWSAYLKEFGSENTRDDLPSE